MKKPLGNITIRNDVVGSELEMIAMDAVDVVYIYAA